jgi:hypothetical protein
VHCGCQILCIMVAEICVFLFTENCAVLIASYNTKIISLPVNAEHGNFTSENIVKPEVISNPSKPLGKQIYIRAAIQKTFSA